jgi:hypothetical protein
MKFGGTQRKQRSMLNVLKKLFIPVLSDLKQDHTALGSLGKFSGSTRAVLGQFYLNVIILQSCGFQGS